MSSPAERYAASRQRQQDASAGLREFADSLAYELDAFQVQACRALQRGAGVLVAAPTGSGKTVVGEYAAFLALRAGARAFYTTPIKALSNQKFREFQEVFGDDEVGLLTGDNSINPHASLVVMTTEVLRNMIYAEPEGLDGLQVVVMDEVHYLADRTRGAVWEEVLIHVPAHVQIVALSATVSNAEEFGAWLGRIRGDVEVVVEEHRPVPLDQHIYIDGRIEHLFLGARRINPEVAAKVRLLGRTQQKGRFHQRPSRVDIVDALTDRNLVPAIYFIFSRAGCEAALNQCRAANLRLTTPDERAEIAAIVDTMSATLPDEDLGVLNWHEWRESLIAGIASHHAGLVPLFKEVVERLFQVGLVKVVFATETLALGINMPARSVVIERLTKWDGHSHVSVSAGEYTQLTGRAGRRGLDAHGDAIVIWEPTVDLGHLAGLASTRTYPLNSSFRPTYNMAVNLIMRHGVAKASALLEKSFAQFQVDARLASLSARSSDLRAEAAAQLTAVECHLGDFDDYFRIREALTAAERAASGRTQQAERIAIEDRLRSVRPGDVLHVNRGRRGGMAVVIEGSSASADDAARPLVMTVDKVLRRVSWTDFAGEVFVASHIRIPAHFSPRSANARKGLAESLRRHVSDLRIPKSKPARTQASDDAIAELRTRLRAHPCHGCHDREAHARAAAARGRALRESATLASKVDARAGSLGRQFERVCAVLAQLGYLSQDPSPAVTPAGNMLARIYADLDLLAAQILHAELLEGLTPAELIGVAAFCVYEARTDEARVDVPLSSQSLRRVLPEIYREWSRIVDVESDFGMSTQRPLDAGLVRPALAWASDQPLSAVLRMGEMSAGDFVRWIKQVVDWLAHIEAAAPTQSSIREAAAAATALINRGIVALAPTG
jgi:ATP-dependent RNA helicase HelY